ncbi:MAG: DNA primase catalytic subunit PriS [Candidatus Altiarchaeota archaeon]|nr:DNA primase catalytic subunit PriS [Candidatus Altiarchaeota archaeon]
MMEVRTKLFLKSRFKEYYERNRVSAPEEIGKREFGFGTLKDKIKIRHKSFASERDLHNFLRREAPFYISYSTAFYEFPRNPMNEKVWQGAELVFDLDVDMDYLDSGKLEKVKKETASLIDFLTGDYGIKDGDIRVNFSGGKGYHIHVLDASLRTLGRDERREIVDYMTGRINFKDFLHFSGVKEEEITGPGKCDVGWYKRLYEGLYEFISGSTQKELEEVKGIGEKKAALIIKKRDRILKELEAGRYDRIPEIVSIERTHMRSGDPNIRKTGRMEKISSPLIDRIIDHLAIHMEAEDTDKMVTIDTSRLIRLPDSIHGGSGLVAKKLSDLDGFDPLLDALAFGKKNMKILIRETVPEFEIGGVKMGPIEPGTIELPECAGMYVLLKDKGDIV